MKTKAKYKQLTKPKTVISFNHFIKENGKFIPFNGISGFRLDSYSVKIYRKL